MLFHWRTL